MNEETDLEIKLEALDKLKKQTIFGNVLKIIEIVLVAIFGIAIVFLEVLIFINVCNDGCSGSGSGLNPSIYYAPSADKPVIYLYPEEETGVHVNLTLEEAEMLAMWPEAGEVNDKTYSWDVTADENGRIVGDDGNEYSYLFWEATGYGDGDFSQGFCVKGSETGEFLRSTLSEIGLTPEEYNEFIVYWLPKMQNNEYNIIRFDGLEENDTYNQKYALNVTDENGNSADSVLRVLMVYEASDEYVEMEPQTFETFERNGFTVVEWGGSEIK
jgi:hypothetical protein